MVMPKSPRNIWKLLLKRYTSTFKDDYYRVKDYFSYYWEPITLEEIFSHYPWDILFLIIRELLRWVFKWPFLVAFCSFSSLVRYIFILWHWLFLDIILRYLARNNYVYLFRFFRLIYRIVSWIERFIINYFGIGLLIEWIPRKFNAIPDWIERHSPAFIRGATWLLDTVIWLAKKYDKGFDYVVSFLDPWSYRKTRYMLSRKYRTRKWLIFKWYKARFFYFVKLQPLRLKGYMAIWVYRIKVLRVEIKFFFRPKVMRAYWTRFYYVYWGGCKLFFFEQLYLFTSWCWQNAPIIFYTFVPALYWLGHIPFVLVFPFYRFIHNYYFSAWWRWGRKETTLVKKDVGRWKVWHSIWKQWARRKAKK